MKILYREQASKDLEDIAAYFGQHSTAALERAHKDIFDYIRLLPNNPNIGRNLEDGTQLVVTIKYRFNITYIANADHIDIVGIYRYQNR